MSIVTLPYQASREWLKAEILAGRPRNHRRQKLVVALSSVDEGLRERVRRISDSFAAASSFASPFVVFDSGIDPSLAYGASSEDLEPMDAPILDRIGLMPEVSVPTESVDEVASAWEYWLDRYQAEALRCIEELNERSPAICKDIEANELRRPWGEIPLALGHKLSITITPEHGARVQQDALAAQLREAYTRNLFDVGSVLAARQAIDVSSDSLRASLETESVESVVAAQLDRRRKIFALAQAHYQARRAQAPSFEEEMARWAKEHGSERLRLGIEDGYRMNARYLAERLAAEVPGFYAMPTKGISYRWASKATSPSKEALQLRRLVAAAIERHAPKTLEGDPIVEVAVVKEPPHQMYEPDVDYPDYPSRAGWRWRTFGSTVMYGKDPYPFEAVIVRNWLGRFHLIGGVAIDGQGPAGIWAVPNPSHFLEDGSVEAQDPDAPRPPSARRKPPGPPKADDDIPF